MKKPKYGLSTKLTLASAAFSLAAVTTSFAAPATINWGTVANNVRTLPTINYGTKITAAAQLNASASNATGTFTYQINGAAADQQLLNAGKAYKIIATFTANPSNQSGIDNTSTYEALIDVDPFTVTYQPKQTSYSRNYGDEKLTFAAGADSVSFSAFANGETVTTVIPNIANVRLIEKPAMVYGTSQVYIDANTVPGTYAAAVGFIVSPTANSNYTLTKVNNAESTLVINRRPLVVTLASGEAQNSFYGDTPVTPTIKTTTGLLAGDSDTAGTGTPNGIRITPRFVGTVTATSAVGEYAATALVEDGTGTNSKIDRYTVTVNNAKFNIKKRKIQPKIYVKDTTATSKTIAYGDPNPVYELKYDANGAGDLTGAGNGFAANESASNFSAAPAVVQPAALPGAGTVTVGYTTGPAATNYEFDLSKTATLVVSPRAVTITGQNIVRVFGGKNYTPAAVVQGTVAATSTAVGAGYAPHHSSINDLYQSSGGIPPTFEGPASTDNQGGDGVDTNNNPVTPIGTYPNKVVVKSGTDVNRNANYSITIINGSVEVTKVLAIIEWNNFDAAALTYGDRLTDAKHFNAVVKFNNNTVNAVKQVTGNEPSTGAGTIKYTAAAGTSANTPTSVLNTTTSLNADSYTITATFTPDATAQPSLATTVATKTITVNKAVLTATTKNQSKAYLAALPTTVPQGTTLEITGFKNSETATTAGIDPAFALNYGSATAASDVGDYTITVTGGASTKNYTITRVETGKLTITAITPAATWPDPSNRAAEGQFANIEYGTLLGDSQKGVVNAPNLTGTTEYFWVDGTTEVAYASAGLTVNNGALHTLRAKYTVQKNGVRDQNYNVQTLTKTILVTAKSLTVTAPSGKTSVYGSALQASVVANTAAGTYLREDGVGLTGIVDNGVINDSQSISVRYTTSATRDSDAGTYSLTANLTDSGNRLANYSLAIGSGTYTISKKPLVVKVKDGKKTKQFLAAPATPAIAPNTELVYVDANGNNGFVTLSAANSVQQNPAVIDTLPTVTITEKNDLTKTITLSATTRVGQYGVKLSDAADNNYSFTYDNTGIYEVTKIRPTLTWTQFDGITQPIKFGDKKADLLGTSTPQAARAVGDTASGTPGNVSLNFAVDSGWNSSLDTWHANSVDANNTLTSTSTSNKRKITATFTPNTSEVNYESFTMDFFIAVVKRKVNVTIDGMDKTTLDANGKPEKGGLTRAYGEFNRPFTVSYTKGETDTKKIFGHTDILEDGFTLDVQPIPYSAAMPETAPGTYTTIATGGVSFRSPGQAPSDADYHFVTSANDGEVAFSITKRPIVISVAERTRPFGSGNGAAVVTGETVNGAGGFGINNKGETDTIAKFSAQPQAVTAATSSSAPGEYIVFVSGSASANYEITHKNSKVIVTKATPTFTWSVGGAITYGTSLSSVQLSPKAWFGTTDITASGSFDVAENPAGAIVNVGSRKLKAKWISNSVNYANVDVVNSDNELVVNPASLSAKAASTTITYGDALPTTFAIEYGPFANPNDNASNITAPAVTTDRAVNAAGSYNLNVTGGVVGNYNIVPQAGGVLTVSKKPVTIVAKAVSRAYGAEPKFDAVPYTITPALVGTDSLGTDIAVTSTTAANANVGIYNLTVAGGQGNANYTVSHDGAGKLTVTPAAVEVAVVNATKKYLAAVPVFELSITPALLFNDSIGLINYTLDSSAVNADSAVGSYAVKITGAAVQGNYAVTFKDGTLTVEKATPTIVWSKPANITFGTALSATQLNAKAQVNSKDVAGTFAYTPAAGDSTLKAGTGQTLSVVFTPTDAANYTTANGSTTLDVDKATPLVVWANPAAITYGTALGNSQLNASSTVAGTFAYEPAAGAVLAAGNRSLTATFTPTDKDNYASVNATATVEVKKASATVAADAKTKQFNAAVPELTSTVTGLLNGDAASVIGIVRLTTTAVATSPIGSYPIRLDGSLAAANYDVTFVPSTLTVTKATPSIAWAAPADIVVGTALGDSQLNATSPIAGIFAYVPAKGTVLPLGNGQKLEAIFIPSDAVNYELVRTVNNINVTAPAAKPVNPADINGDGSSDVIFQHTDGFLAAWYMEGAILKQGVLFSPETAGDARWEVVGYGDFNGDTKGDILFQYNGGNFDGALAIWYLNGVQQTDAKLVTPEFNPGAGWSAVSVADFNGDKKADILFQHDEGFMALWTMDGANSTSKSLLNPVAPFGLDGTIDVGWRAVAATDLNGDKNTDIVFQYAGGSFDRTVAVWYMKGTSQSGAALLEPSNPGAGWSVAAAADYNGDSKNDLLLQHSSGLLGIWYLNGNVQTSATLVSPESPGAGWRVVAP